MKFIEIIKKVNWDDVRAVLYDYYYENSEDYQILDEYERIFNELKYLKPQDCKGMRLYVEYIKDTEADKDPVVEVIGRNGTLNKESEDFKFWGNNVSEEIANKEITYALEMVCWEEWLDMNISLDIIKNFSMPEIIAHCIYEMTFMGFSQKQIQGKLDELRKSCENIENSKGIDMEELRKIIEDMDKKEDKEDENN
jgi:hypothetical protein